MRHLGELLAGLPLPNLSALPSGPPGDVTSSDASAPAALAGCDQELVHVLGAGLPAGHLHVWGGPSGAGKTAFLLCLLHGASRRGRRVAYATYDLSAATLALRLLSMGTGTPTERLAEGGLDAAAGERVARARETFGTLPFWFLEARGLGVASLEDRIARMPFRPEVLAVDYLQAVVREPGAELGQTLRELSALASRLHVAVVCALRADPRLDGSGADRTIEEIVRGAGAGAASQAPSADRVGWIAPAAGSGTRRAEVLRNRYGDRPAMPLRFDPATGALRRDPDEAAGAGASD